MNNFYITHVTQEAGNGLEIALLAFDWYIDFLSKMLVESVLPLITQPTATHINNNINRTAHTIADAIISYIPLQGTGLLYG